MAKRKAVRPAARRKRPAGNVGGQAAMRIQDLTPDPQNARRHGERNVGAIVAALQEVGAARSIVIDEAGVIRAGNATVKAALEAGLSKLKVVDVDGDTLVAVRRSGLSPEQLERLALFDNRAAELAEGWDPEVLAELQAQGVSMEGLWTGAELAALAGVADNPEEHWKGMPGFDHEEQGAWKSLTVNFKNKADLEAFARLVNQTITDRTRSIWYPPAEIGRYADKAYEEVVGDVEAPKA